MNGTSETVVDGVHRYPAKGIKVVIVGAGNGGLTAALECWRKGFDVVVLERAAELSPLGDFFTIPPSALTTLKDYPRLYKRYHSKVHDCVVRLMTPSGHVVASLMPEWKREGIVHTCPEVDISFLNRRPEYAAWQLEQVQALGIPVHFSTQALNVTETDDKVIIHTDKGEYESDVVVAADGIGSRVPWPVPGGLSAVKDSGYAVARVAFPRDTIKKGSPAEALSKSVDEEGPQFRTYVGGDDVSLIIFLTKDYVAWAFSHEADAYSAESWHNQRDPEDIITVIEKSSNDWDPAVLDFVRQTPVKVVDWRLMWRDSIEQWTSDKGRIIKLGDSAHAFFPTAGNGAVQAQEDGISLAECLHQAGTKENIPWATRVHNALRFQRVSILQQTGFVNREELHHSTFDESAHAPDGEVPPDVGFFKIGRWVWDHNPEDYARRSYQKCLEHVRDGKKFYNTNIPPGHVFKSWTLESEYKRMAEGGHSGLKENGYWGM